MEANVDTTRVFVRQVTKVVAKNFVKKHHYSHRFSSCRYALGLFYREKHDHPFFAGDNESLIGVMSYGHPVSNRAVDSITTDDSVTLESVLELTRLVILDNYGSNIESHFIGQSFRWLRHHAPEVKILISYADPEYSHNGVIYQATNWLYQGIGSSKLMPDYQVRLTEDGEWIHSRTVGAKFGPKNIDVLAKRIGHKFWRKEESSKHRYIYLLGNRREKKEILKKLKLPLQPYPDASFKWEPPIQQIEIVDGTAVTTWL